jgi:glycosyltransferase involved in cell wall biosynthesis
MNRKLISICTPCYNEEANVREIYLAVRAEFAKLPQYRYEHVFIDNASTDRTAAILRELAAEDPQVKVLLNTRNFGPVRSSMHAFLQCRGDAVIGLVADFQDPPEMIPELLSKWEAGFKTVLTVKQDSDEHGLMFFIRSRYYALLARIADLRIVENATGSGLFDKAVVDAMRQIDDPYPFFRGLVAEIGYDVVTVPYRQPRRARGVSSLNFYMLYEMAFLGVVSYSKVPLRLATMLGFAMAALSLIVALGYLVAKLVFWKSFILGTAPLLIGFFFLSAVQLFFVGIVGEYVGSIYTTVRRRPLVFERERLNFTDER